MTRGDRSSQTRRRRLVLSGCAAILFAAVFALRFAAPDPNEAVTLLYVIPIALLAMEFGMWAGLGAAAFALFLFAVWNALAHAGMGPEGFLSRGLAFFLLGGVVGAMATANRALAAENLRQWEISLDLMCTSDLNGQFLRVNPAFERVLGYTQQELTARPFSTFVHPDDRERTALEAARLGIDGTESVDFQNRYLARDGSVHWLEWRSAHVSEGVIYSTARVITERKALEARLAEMIRQDPLTGLLNRRGFYEKLDARITHVRRYASPTSLLSIDLDGFKSVNDLLGHAAGDDVLVTVAQCLRALLRQVDVLGRLGGDEFLVLLPETSEENARAVAARVVTTIAAALAAPGVTASVGAVVFADGKATDPDEWLAAADAALYEAKRAGRNRVALRLSS